MKDVGENARSAAVRCAERRVPGGCSGHTEPAIWRAGEQLRVPKITGLVLRDPAGDPLLTRTGRGNCSSLPDYRLTHMIFRTVAASGS